MNRNDIQTLIQEYGIPSHPYNAYHVDSVDRSYAFLFKPGFWRADESTARLERDPVKWYNNVKSMIASGEPWQLVTTFNEWGEGTATERCLDWPSNTSYGSYLDALYFDGVIQTSVEDYRSEDKIHIYYEPAKPGIICNKYECHSGGALSYKDDLIFRKNPG